MAKISTLTPQGAEPLEQGKALVVSRTTLTNQSPVGSRVFIMSSDELYCIHTEELGIRFPDGWREHYVWSTDKRRIESKVVYGDQIVVFISVLAPDGHVWHEVKPYWSYLVLS